MCPRRVAETRTSVRRKPTGSSTWRQSTPKDVAQSWGINPALRTIIGARTLAVRKLGKDEIDLATSQTEEAVLVFFPVLAGGQRIHLRRLHLAGVSGSHRQTLGGNSLRGGMQPREQTVFHRLKDQPQYCNPFSLHLQRARISV